MILAEEIACTALAIMIDPAVFLAELDCGDQYIMPEPQGLKS